VNRREIKSRILWGIAAVCVIALFIIKKIQKDNSLKLEHRYTVGITFNTYKGIKQPMPFVEFEYYVSNKKYKGQNEFNPDLSQVEIGRKYLVIYSPSNPENSRMLLSELLADSIQAPYGGWDEPPFGLKVSDDIKW